MKKIIVIPALVGVLGIGAAVGSTTLLAGKAQEQKALTVQEIEKKALAIVKGTVTDIEFDKESTGDVYEVEITTATEEYDLKLDAYTGELLKQKVETLNDDDDRDDTANKQTENNTAVKITKEEAIKAAMSQANGTVTQVELEDGGVYEITIEDGELEYEVEVDGSTIKIISVEQDDED
ncbi:MAG: PepSY domain-containing protein [Lysinibacillus sp.]